MLFPQIETLADLLSELGVDAERVRLHPPPGTATEKDVIAALSVINRCANWLTAC